MKNKTIFRAERELYFDYYDDDDFAGFWSEEFQEKVAMAVAKICFAAEELAEMQVRLTIRVAKLASQHWNYRPPFEPSAETQFLKKFKLTSKEFLECRMSRELTKVFKAGSMIPITREELLRIIRSSEDKRSWTTKI